MLQYSLLSSRLLDELEVCAVLLDAEAAADRRHRTKVLLLSSDLVSQELAQPLVS